jgi:hypothetical protein
VNTARPAHFSPSGNCAASWVTATIYVVYIFGGIGIICLPLALITTRLLSPCTILQNFNYLSIF